jgi:hypothetical protein
MTEFPPLLPHGVLEEIMPDVFYVRGQIQIPANDVVYSSSRNMYVLRSEGLLTLVNSIRLDEAGLKDIESLGTIRHLVKLGAFHGRDDAFYIDQYDLTFWTPPQMTFSRGEETNEFLQPNKIGPCADSSVFLFDTPKHPEAILHLARHDGIILTCDSIQNNIAPDEYFNQAGIDMKRRNGFFKPAGIGPGWLKAAAPSPKDFERLKTLQYQHLLSAHGDPLLGNAKSVVDGTIDAQSID